MGTNTGTVMTLANGIIGVSVLAMPFCFKQCGIVLSILMLVCSSFVSRLACYFLLKAAIMARRRNFEFLAFHIFGSTGKFTAELFIIGFLMGTCIAFFVVMGDLGPAIVAKALGISNSDALRPSVLIGLAVFVVLPLGLLRNVDSLASVCTVTIGFYGCLVLKVMSEATPHLLAGDWLDKVHLWRPAGIMQCIPIFSMALFCQTQLFEIYDSLHNASLERMNDVIRAAVNMCTTVYICVGFFGYVAYCTQTFSGNVMMSFTPSAVSEIIKVGFVLSVAVSFPLVIFPCRASLYSLLFRRECACCMLHVVNRLWPNLNTEAPKMGVPHHEVVSGHIPETRFKCLTVFIISMALLVGLLIPNIELVLGLVGSTIGVLICVMFPAAAFIFISSKSSHERLVAQVLLFVGALILVSGTYATLYAANETAVETAVITPKSDVNRVAQLANKIAEEPAHRMDSPEQKAEAKARIEDIELSATAQARQEPPVPIEPQDNPKVVMKEPPVPLKSQNSPELVAKELPLVVDSKTVAPDQQVPEPEKKEEAKLVDQDAIRKEDEELAEAEKRSRNEADKKDAELLRKLEKHEEEQIKLLQEQKKILQALQEHKKEIERSKNLTAIQTNEKVKVEPNILPGKINAPEQSVMSKGKEQNAMVLEKNILSGKEVVAKEDINIAQKNRLLENNYGPELRGVDKGDTSFEQPKVKFPDKINVPESNVVPKDDLNIIHKKVIIPKEKNGPEQKIESLNNAPDQRVVAEKNLNIIPLKPLMPGKVNSLEQVPAAKDNIVPQQNDGVQNIPLQGIQVQQKGQDAAPQNIAALEKDVKMKVNILEKSLIDSKREEQKNAPLPQHNFIGQQIKGQSAALQEKQNVMEKLNPQPPVPANFLLERLKSPLLAQNKLKTSDQDAKVMRREILHQPLPKSSKEGLEREKRDVDEENCVATESAQEQLKDNSQFKTAIQFTESKMLLLKIEEGVHLEETNVSLPKEPKIQSLEPPKMDENVHQEVLPKKEPNVSLDKSVTHLTSTITPHLAPQRMEEGLPQEEQNVSLIKSAKHLTEPKVQPLVSQNLENDLQQGGLLQEAKPMSRDLKSLATHQDKEE